MSSGRSANCTDSHEIGKVILGIGVCCRCGVGQCPRSFGNSVVAIPGRRSQDILQDPQSYRTVLLSGLGAMKEPKINTRRGAKRGACIFTRLHESDDSTSACCCTSKFVQRGGPRLVSLGPGHITFYTCYMEPDNQSK